MVWRWSTRKKIDQAITVISVAVPKAYQVLILQAFFPAAVDGGEAG